MITHHTADNFEYVDGGETVLLAVALPSSAASNYTFDAQAWDDHCQECGGWEFIDGEADGRMNQFGGK